MSCRENCFPRRVVYGCTLRVNSGPEGYPLFFDFPSALQSRSSHPSSPTASCVCRILVNDFVTVLRTTGDVLFLSGITMTIGTRRTFVFFFKRRQLRGNLFFFGGIALVFFNRPFFGMILQVRVLSRKYHESQDKHVDGCFSMPMFRHRNDR